MYTSSDMKDIIQKEIKSIVQSTSTRSSYIRTNKFHIPEIVVAIGTGRLRFFFIGFVWPSDDGFDLLLVPRIDVVSILGTHQHRRVGEGRCFQSCPVYSQIQSRCEKDRA